MSAKVSCWRFTDGPDTYRTLIAEDCLHGLGALIEEADYGRTPNAPDPPELRAYRVRLAYAMRDAGHGDAAGVVKWIEAAAADPLPEVRNAEARRASDDD